MKYVVVGVARSQGEFKGREYDNIMLHCLTDAEVLNGHKTEILKVKNDFKSKVEANGNPVDKFTDLVGCEVKPYFDRFGGIELLKVVSIDGQI